MNTSQAKPGNQTEFLAEKHPLKGQKAGTLEDVGGSRFEDNPPNFSCVCECLSETDTGKVPSYSS